MENKTTQPQGSSYYGLQGTGEEMVEQKPMMPGSVFAPERPSVVADVSRDMHEDGVLESEYMQEQKVKALQTPASTEPSVPQAVSTPKVRHVLGSRPMPVMFVLVALLSLATISSGLFLISRVNDSITEQSQNTASQSLNIPGLETSGGIVDEIRQKQDETQLIVKGNVIATQKLGIYSDQFLGQLSLGELSEDRLYLLPDNSGEFCLDSNNCNYALQNSVVSSIGGLSGVVNLGGGLSVQGDTLISAIGETGVITVINGSSGQISIQGSLNQVQVATSGNVITLTTPQDIATSSSPSFQSISLTSPGTQAGNLICDDSNNCGYALSGNYFVHNGNSYGEAAVLGTNDAEALIFETAGANRAQITADGAVLLDGGVTTGAYAKLHVPYVNGEGITFAGASAFAGDVVALSYFGGTNASNGTTSILAQSYSGNALVATSVDGVGIYAESANSYGLAGLSLAQHGIFGFAVADDMAGVYGSTWGDGYGVLGQAGSIIGPTGDAIGVGAIGQQNYGLYATSYGNTSAYFQASSTLFCFLGCATIVPTEPTVVIQQLDTQTADLLEIQMSDNTPVFQVGYNGHTAIGNVAAVDDTSVILPANTFSTVLNIEEQVTDFSNDYTTGMNIALELAPTANVTTEVIGNDTYLLTEAGNIYDLDTITGQVTVIDNQGDGNITGDAKVMTSAIIHSGSGTIASSWGGQALILNTGSGDVTNVIGQSAQAFNMGTGTITTAKMLSTQIANFTANPITTATGLEIGVNSGLIDNNYGIFVNDQSGAGTFNSYNIYSAGVNSNNYFEGSLSVGEYGDFGVLNVVSGGLGSIAAGASNVLSGDESIAFGDSNTVSGDYSGALGSANTNDGLFASFTIGNTNSISATSTYGIAIGYANSIDTDYGYALGSGNTVNSFGNTGIALGDSNTVNGGSAWALGYNNTSDGTVSGVIGSDNFSSANRSIAIGQSLTIDSSANGTVGINLSATPETISQANSFVVMGGDMGLGTTAPSYRLDVSDNASGSYAANFLNDGNNQDRYGIRIQAGADDASGTTYYLDAYDGDGGQVGYIANVAGTFGITDVSDIRTKTNVTDTEVNAMDILSGLRIVDFNRLQNPNGSRITGFIAQEVEQIYSQAITTGSDGYLGVMKDAFIPLLVKGHQEQQAQLDSLGTRVNNVQNYYNDTVINQIQQSSDFVDLNVSGVATITNLTVQGALTTSQLTVAGDAVFEGNITVAGDVTLNGRVLGNSFTRGRVTVAASTAEVEYAFEREFGDTPNVVITPTNAFAPDYRVEATTMGFRLILREPATEDIVFNYQVQQ